MSKDGVMPGKGPSVQSRKIGSTSLPFHESILKALKVAFDNRETWMLFNLIKETQIVDGHDMILKYLNDYHGDNPSVESVIKHVLDEKALINNDGDDDGIMVGGLENLSADIIDHQT